LNKALLGGGVQRDSLLSGLSKEEETKEEDMEDEEEEEEEGEYDPADCEMEGVTKTENGIHITISVPVIYDIGNRVPDTEDTPGLIIVTQTMRKYHIRFTTRALRDTIKRTMESQLLPPQAPVIPKSVLDWWRNTNGYSPVDHLQQMGAYCRNFKILKIDLGEESSKWCVLTLEKKSLVTLRLPSLVSL
jgi:hypothetical protein